MVATRSPGCDAERRQQAADPRGALDEPRVRGMAVLGRDRDLVGEPLGAIDEERGDDPVAGVAPRHGYTAAAPSGAITSEPNRRSASSVSSWLGPPGWRNRSAR